MRRGLGWTAVARVLGLLAFAAAGCGGGGGDDGGPERIEGLGTNLPTAIGARRGRRSTSSSGRATRTPQWAKPFEQQTGCKVNTKDGASSDDMIDLIARRRPVRRRVGVRQRERCGSCRGGDVAPIERRTRSRTTRTSSGAQVPAVQQHRRQATTASRTVGARTCSLYRTDVVKGTDQLGVIWTSPVQGQALGPGRPDLHRGRRRLPEGDPAGPEDQQPVRARRQAVQRGRRPAQAAAAADQEVLGADSRRDRSRSRTRTPSSARPGRTR